MSKKLRFYYSAMNAGKTLDLLRTNHTYERLGGVCWLIKPAIDTRSEGRIESRLGISAECTMIKESENIWEKWIREVYRPLNPYRAILADEVQFFSEDQIDQLALICDRYEIPVLCYGLRTDYNGQPFAGSKRLLAIADEIKELITLCHCGSKATMNLRIDGTKVITGDGQVFIGAEEAYVSVCRRHWRAHTMAGRYAP